MLTNLPEQHQWTLLCLCEARVQLVTCVQCEVDRVSLPLDRQCLGVHTEQSCVSPPNPGAWHGLAPGGPLGKCQVEGWTNQSVAEVLGPGLEAPVPGCWPDGSGPFPFSLWALLAHSLWASYLKLLQNLVIQKQPQLILERVSFSF